MGRWVIQKRFSWMASNSDAHQIDHRVLAEYLRHLWSQLPAGSERALNLLLNHRRMSGGVSIHDRLTSYGKALHPSCEQWELSMIYGNHSDWMGSHHGKHLQEVLEVLGKPGVTFDCLDTGHQIFNEDPKGCANAILSAINSCNSAALS